MRRFSPALLLLLMLLTARPGSAQTVFAPAGAEWWYETMAVAGPYLTRVTVAGDTVLPGRPGVWEVLQSQTCLFAGTSNFAFLPPGPATLFAYTQVRGDQVWSLLGQTEALLFDFSRPVGYTDSLVACLYPTQPALSYAAFVDSVTAIGWGGTSLRVQWRSAPMAPRWDGLRQFTGGIRERIGYPHAVILPELECGTDPDLPELTYYQDVGGTFGTYPRILGLPEPVALRAILPAPNPSATGRFKLNGLPTGTTTYAVFDAQGRRVRAGKLTGADLDLSDQPAGLYLLRGEVVGQPFARRLVRE